MAKKGVKHNKYEIEFVKKVLEEYYSGQGGFTFLANKYNIPIKTIKGWVYRTNKGIDIYINKHNRLHGRPKKDEIDYKERYEILKKYLAFIKARREKK